MGLSTYHMLKIASTGNRIELEGELLKELQSTLLSMLLDIVNVCEKYGFFYSLSGGTALGAVRHKGFIPWDDDIDIFMMRSDYQKFIDVFEKELGSQYYLNSMETTPELGFPMAQMMKKGTVFITNTTLGEKDAGVFIDICLLDNTPDNSILRFGHGVISDFLGLCVSCSRFYRKRDQYESIYSHADTKTKRAVRIKIFLGKLLSFRSLKSWTTSYSKWISRCKNDNSKYLVCATGFKHYFGELFLRSVYGHNTNITFENHELKIISGYDWALKNLYGDNYMEIPPIEKREKHFVMDIKL